MQHLTADAVNLFATNKWRLQLCNSPNFRAVLRQSLPPLGAFSGAPSGPSWVLLTLALARAGAMTTWRHRGGDGCVMWGKISEIDSLQPVTRIPAVSEGSFRSRGREGPGKRESSPQSGRPGPAPRRDIIAALQRGAQGAPDRPGLRNELYSPGNQSLARDFHQFSRILSRFPQSVISSPFAFLWIAFCAQGRQPRSCESTATPPFHLAIGRAFPDDLLADSLLETLETFTN